MYGYKLEVEDYDVGVVSKPQLSLSFWCVDKRCLKVVKSVEVIYPLSLIIPTLLLLPEIKINSQQGQFSFRRVVPLLK